jgi:hypothetical protein
VKQGCDGNGNEIRRDEGESSEEILWNVEQVCHACSHNKYEAELLSLADQNSFGTVWT